MATTTKAQHTPGPWTAVRIVQNIGDEPRLEFCDLAEKYHVWLERETLRPRPTPWGHGGTTLYANPLVGAGKTRALRADSARWAPVIEALLGRFDLAAERVRLAEEARQHVEARQREASERAREERIRSAAPDLLAALERAEALFDRVGFQEMRGLAWHDGDRDLMRAAIAKARG